MSQLTVKWVVKYREGEITRIFPADEVAVAYKDASVSAPLEVHYVMGLEGKIMLCRNNDQDKHAEDSAALLINPHDERTARHIGCGTCYVMNEAGKTIGSYRLDDVDVNGIGDQPGIFSSHSARWREPSSF